MTRLEAWSGELWDSGLTSDGRNICERVGISLRSRGLQLALAALFRLRQSRRFGGA